MFFKDVNVHGFFTPAELWVNLRHLVEANPNSASIFGSTPVRSTISRITTTRMMSAPRLSLVSSAMTFEQHFLESSPRPFARAPSILLTADHGMIATEKSARYDLRNHPELTRLLHILPTGENRLMYLFIRPGETDNVRSYFDQTWPGQFSLPRSI